MSRSLVLTLLAIFFTICAVSAQTDSEIDQLIEQVIDEETSPMPVLYGADDDRFHIDRVEVDTLDDDQDMSSTCSATTSLNVRTGPSTSYSRIGLLHAGESVTRTGTSGHWSIISYGGKTAYAHSDYLRCGGSSSTTKCSATTNLNVRTGPSTSYSKIGLLYAGQEVTRTGSTGHWSIISFNGKTAYSHSDYLRCDGSSSGSSGGGSSSGSSGGNGKHYPLFKQCDSRWKNDKLGSSSTVCKVGCLMSSVSMAMNGLGKKINGQSANPGTLNRYLNHHHGYSGNLFIWGSVSPFGLHYMSKSRSHNTIREACNNPHRVVILNVRHGGHWVACTGTFNGGYHVRDPGYNVSKYRTSDVVQAGIFKV